MELQAKISILENKLKVLKMLNRKGPFLVRYLFLLQESDVRTKEEEEAKNLMYAEYAELRHAFDQFKDSVKEQEDPVVLRLALDQSRRDLSKAHALVAKFRWGNRGKIIVCKNDLSCIHCTSQKLSTAKATKGSSY